MPRWSKLILFAVLVGFGIGLPLNLLTARAQRIASNRAKQFAAETQPTLAKDSRLSAVEIYEFSSFGAVRIAGTVASEADLEALKKQIESTRPGSPRIAVTWAVKITSPTSDGPDPIKNLN